MNLSKKLLFFLFSIGSLAGNASVQLGIEESKTSNPAMTSSALDVIYHGLIYDDALNTTKYFIELQNTQSNVGGGDALLDGQWLTGGKINLNQDSGLDVEQNAYTLRSGIETSDLWSLVADATYDSVTSYWFVSGSVKSSSLQVGKQISLSSQPDEMSSFSPHLLATFKIGFNDIASSPGNPSNCGTAYCTNPAQYYNQAGYEIAYWTFTPNLQFDLVKWFSFGFGLQSTIYVGDPNQVAFFEVPDLRSPLSLDRQQETANVSFHLTHAIDLWFKYMAGQAATISAIETKEYISGLKWSTGRWGFYLEYTHIGTAGPIGPYPTVNTLYPNGISANYVSSATDTVFDWAKLGLNYEF